MKVCPYRNRGQCSFTENDVTDGRLVCPTHMVPLVDAVDPPPVDPPELDTALVCSRDPGHTRRDLALNEKCWCGAALTHRGDGDGDGSGLVVDPMIPTNGKETKCRIVVECEGERFESGFESGSGEILIGRGACFSEELRMLLLRGHNGVSREHLMIKPSENAGMICVREARSTTNGTFAVIDGERKRIAGAWQEIGLPARIELGNPETSDPRAGGAMIEVKNG